MELNDILKTNGTCRFYKPDEVSDEVLAEGEIRSFTSYSAPVFSAQRGSIAGNPVSVLTAERDAHERLMAILADRLADQLIATAPAWRL